MKKQLHEKSRVIDKTPLSSHQQDSRPPSLDIEEMTAMNAGGHYRSRIPGAAVASSTDSLTEPQLEDLQAANCVIS